MLKLQIVFAHVELPRLHLVERLLLSQTGLLLLDHLDPNAVYLKSNPFKLISKRCTLSRGICMLQGGAHGVDSQRQEPQLVSQDGQRAAFGIGGISMDHVKDFVQVGAIGNKRGIGSRHRQQPPH